MPRQRNVTKNMVHRAAISNHIIVIQPSEFVDTLVRRMERAFFNTTVKLFERMFKDHSWDSKSFLEYYSALAALYAINLDVGSSLGSSYLAKKLVSGEIKPEDICNYSSKDINPDASETERAYIETRQKQKVDEKYTTRYQCHRCFEHKATYNEVQIARADEAASNRLTCLHCGNTWFKTGV